MLQQYDPRNEHIKVFVKDRLIDRKEASVSVFDSSVQGGDAVWEGLRVYAQGVFMLDRHLDRLMASAKALAFEKIPDRKFLTTAIFDTLLANRMTDGTHIRLTLTRGEKITSGMDPRLNRNGCTLIVLAEFKDPVYDKNGIKVITTSVNRNNPRFLDSKIHHNNLLNNILAKIQANVAGVDDALMLDEHGFVAELNGTNLFMVKDGKVFTPAADSCLPGITRGLVIEICQELDIQISERNISLTEFYNADSVFTTGTMGELVPLYEIDGRQISRKDEILNSITAEFDKKKPELCTPFPDT